MSQRRVQFANCRKRIHASLLPIVLLGATLCCFAQFAPAPDPTQTAPAGADAFGQFPGRGPSDPGVQNDPRGTGAALVTAANDPGGYLAFFNDALDRFQEEDAVANGLGPRFNSNSCSSCHAQPAVGGSSPAANPQFKFATNGVAPGNRTPDFITADGPVREARFPFFMTPGRGGFGFGRFAPQQINGGVEPLFTVSGRPDAGACRIQQPNFAAAEQANDIIFRIPTPTFGSGLIENLDDSTLLSDQDKNQNNNL